ncbi:hypothetical protein AZI87_01755 [Bdellovibrio bacteriovorus]|uniref:NADH:flavin oxidoreductase/NADH oxidase N-terminal domain-containing protein n=1 Tax=Bdellovibrio bacteriovorus TaxID=959 RepID=A0A162GFJ5_BDEBC|nr:hypothetical protein [Bdellovibrio bacteriovorus]KYG68021.1 hypothetical protein AZI87_01755 [Bdellovibrio bacteriovorus]
MNCSIESFFEPLKLGPYTLKNRIIMAPLTRSRAVGEGRIPNDLMTKYYKQRSSAGMILIEATAVIFTNSSVDKLSSAILDSIYSLQKKIGTGCGR